MGKKIFFSAILLAGVIFAAWGALAVDCGANDAFLKSKDNNAHAATCDYTGSNYLGVNAGVAGTRLCDGSNGVIRLYKYNNNTHAARPDIAAPNPDYFDVCYGNLRCDINPGTGNCLYSISNDSNAHVADCGFANYQNIYCSGSSGGCPSPSAEILAPPETGGCDIFGIADIINFSQKQANDGTCFDYHWDFGDGTTSIDWSTNHQYSTTGQKNVILTVTRKSDGVVSKDEINLLIVDTAAPIGTKYACAMISDPDEGDSFAVKEYVLFNGSLSYAVERLDSGSSKFKCIAGACPACILNPTGSGASSCTGSSREIADPDNIRNKLDNSGGWSNLNFSWDFGDGTKYSGNGFDFIKTWNPYKTAGNYIGKLAVIIANDASVSGSDEVGFKITREPGCSQDKTIYVDSNGNEISTLDPNYYCDPNTPCCPMGYTCNSSLKCDYNSTQDNFCRTISYCSDYLDSDACKRDACPRQSACTGSSDDFTIIDNGNCFWNATASIKCQSNCSLIAKRNPYGPAYDCRKTYSQTPCTNSYFTLSWIADIVPVPSDPVMLAELQSICTTGSQSFSCGKVAKLAFFSLRNALGVVLLLIAFYLIINRKKISKKMGRA